MDEPHDLPARIRDRLSARLFDAPIMQNQIRPLYVEAMIEEALGPTWRYVGGNWAGWDFESERGPERVHRSDQTEGREAFPCRNPSRTPSGTTAGSQFILAPARRSVSEAPTCRSIAARCGP